MQRQLSGCACILLSVLAALGCRKQAGRAPDTAVTSSPPASTNTVAVAPAPLRSPMAGARAGASPAISGTVGQAASSSRTVPLGPARDSLSKRGDSTTIVPASPPTPLATSPLAPAMSAPATIAPTPPKPSAIALALGRLPFGDKERLEYQVKYGFLGVGSAVLEVLGLDSIRGAPAVHATFTVKGGIRIYRVNDMYESWFDPESYSTLRAVQNIDEGSYDRQRNFEFFPDRKMLSENGKPETPTVDDPLDEASFLFFLRSIPLEVGRTYEFARYFRPDKNPVRVEVVRRERVKVPAGEFNAIVVRPVIKTSGIFGEGGRAEVWFSDDSTRTLLQLKSALKFGSLNLYLRNRRPGMPWPGAVTVAEPSR